MSQKLSLKPKLFERVEQEFKRLMIENNIKKVSVFIANLEKSTVLRTPERIAKKETLRKRKLSAKTKNEERKPMKPLLCRLDV
jgi:hypothetical protein